MALPIKCWKILENVMLLPKHSGIIRLGVEWGPLIIKKRISDKIIFTNQNQF